MFIIGDLTVADYSLDQNYQTSKYPLTAYSGGKKEDTHFQPEESKSVAQLVIEAIKNFKR